MRVEFFSADCRLCEQTLNLLYEHLPGVDIEVHRASQCVDGSCCALAARYGIRAVPALVVNGRVALVGVPDERTLKTLVTTWPQLRG
jgi:hypothetical protein